VTGYHRPIKNWNNGKAEEFKDRKFFTNSVKVVDGKIKEVNIQK